MNARRPRTEIARTGLGVVVLATVLAAGVGLALLAGGDQPGRAAAVAFAAGVTAAGSVGGWLLARWPTGDPASGVAKGLAAIAVRMFPPLIALGWLQSGGNALRAAGADRLLLIFYLALLATDILLHIMGRGDPPGIGGKNAAN